MSFTWSGENDGTGNLLVLASDDAVGAMRVEVRARTGPMVAPLSVPVREVFEPMEDPCPALFVREATPRDEAELLLLWPILLDVPGTGN